MRTPKESQGKITLRGEEIPFQYILSDRRSMAIQVRDGSLIVRAPFGFPMQEAILFLQERQNWILQKLAQSRAASQLAQQQPACTGLNEQQKKSLEMHYRALAREVLFNRITYYLPKTGGQYTSITIREQKTRWGSCSARGTLSFNWRLILAPPVVLDYVVVHELCHLQHMDHSAAFWHAVSHVMPDYKIRRKWLKVHGQELSVTYEPLPFSTL